MNERLKASGMPYSECCKKGWDFFPPYREDETDEETTYRVREWKKIFARFEEHYKTEHGACFGCRSDICYAARVAPEWVHKANVQENLKRRHWKQHHKDEEVPSVETLASFACPDAVKEFHTEWFLSRSKPRDISSSSPETNNEQ